MTKRSLFNWHMTRTYEGIERRTTASRAGAAGSTRPFRRVPSRCYQEPQGTFQPLRPLSAATCAPEELSTFTTSPTIESA